MGKKLNYRIINIAALMILLYFGIVNIGLLWKVLTKCVSVLAPFIVGFAFAYAFTPLVRWLEKKNVPRLAALLIVIFGLILIVLLMHMIDYYILYII